MRWLSGRPGTRWNQHRTSGPGSTGELSAGLRHSGTQPAVVYSRSKNLAELYQVPRR